MQTFQELMVSALAEAGYSDEQVTTALGKIYANDKLSAKLNGLVKTATEDYQAQVGRVKQYQDWYPKAQAEYDRMATAYKESLDELTAMRNGTGTAPTFDASKYVSKEDLIQMQREMGTRYASVIKDTAEITAEHVARFREKPDLNAIDKLATEQNIPLRMAYEKYIEPRVKDEAVKANEQWKKDQREEIERDIRSRYKLPVDATPAETSPLYRHTKPEDVPKDMDAELLNAWHSVPAKT